MTDTSDPTYQPDFDRQEKVTAAVAAENERIRRIGGPAFPSGEGQWADRGMSLRDWFAGQVVAEFVNRSAFKSSGNLGSEMWRADRIRWREFIAADAYGMADAMIAERAK